MELIQITGESKYSLHSINIKYGIFLEQQLNPSKSKHLEDLQVLFVGIFVVRFFCFCFLMVDLDGSNQLGWLRVCYFNIFGLGHK